MNQRVLCLFLEFNWWETARSLPYPAQLGLEEGLRVWVEIVHRALDDDWLDFLSRLAPVRVGLLLESLHYDDATYAASPHYRAHLFLLRRLRRRLFRRWMEALDGDPVVVNLPHSVGTYPGRVVEAMAAGRPVVAWDVPGRPRNRALFEDGAEILLFSGTEGKALASALSRLRRDPARATAIATNGCRKVRRAHTIERRVRQILAWTDTGDAPVFS